MTNTDERMAESDGTESVQRPCAKCLVVDGLPRNMIDVGGPETIKFHLDCDPHPELDEPAATSQFRMALELAGITPPDDLSVAVGDASDPAIQAAPLEDS